MHAHDFCGICWANKKKDCTVLRSFCYSQEMWLDYLLQPWLANRLTWKRNIPAEAKVAYGEYAKLAVRKTFWFPTLQVMPVQTVCPCSLVFPGWWCSCSCGTWTSDCPWGPVRSDTRMWTWVFSSPFYSAKIQCQIQRVQVPAPPLSLKHFYLYLPE